MAPQRRRPPHVRAREHRRRDQANGHRSSAARNGDAADAAGADADTDEDEDGISPPTPRFSALLRVSEATPARNRLSSMHASRDRLSRDGGPQGWQDDDHGLLADGTGGEATPASCARGGRASAGGMRER